MKKKKHDAQWKRKKDDEEPQTDDWEQNYAMMSERKHEVEIRKGDGERTLTIINNEEQN